MVSTTSCSNLSPRLRDVGEFGLIERLQQRIAARRVARGTGLLLSIGDDAAVWQPAAGARQVITTDALVEDVHFRRSTTSWRDLGWKSLAVNVSDVAAMGASPRYALVTLALPGDTVVADIEALYDGMLDLAERYAIEIIGGDVVSAPTLALNVTVIGETSGELLRRDAGRPGDLLAVTGTLGGSAGGLRLLERGGCAEPRPQALIEAHLRPAPRVAEGAALAASGVRCAMDLSDGLLGDAAHICERSQVGAVIDVDAVPLHVGLETEFGEQALALAIGGGEDYELLCAGPPDAIERARAALDRYGTPLSVIGRLTDRASDGQLVTLVNRDGEPVNLASVSWDHFGA